MDKEISVEDVFSLRRPRDIRAGIASGLKSVAKGLVGGTVGLLAAPTVGAVQDGLPGFARGVAAGVVGAVLLPVAGASVAAIQFTRGIINQPEAITANIKGKAWDQEHRYWVDQPQSALTEYDASAATHWHRLGISSILGGRRQHLDYYELLEVPRDAAPEHIRRQYYKLARRHHPDKNAGDDEAHQRFQQLGEAYQVLSNPSLRQQYDKHGAEGLHTDDLMDSAAFFACLFGSEMFDHLIGELALATIARLGDDGSAAAELQHASLQRVQQLSVCLVALLRRYVEGDVEGFRLAMQQEAQRLAAASFGVTLLHCISAVYSSCADIYLGGLVGGTLARVRQGTESLRCHLVVAGAALKVVAHQDKLAAFDRDCEQQREQQQQQARCEDPNHQQPTWADAQHQQQQQQGLGGGYGNMGSSADLLYDSVWFGQRGGGCSNGHQHHGSREPQQLEQHMQQQHAENADNEVSSSVASSTGGSILSQLSETPPELLDHLFDRLPLNGCAPNGLARTTSGTAVAAAAGQTVAASDATARIRECSQPTVSRSAATLSAADGNGFKQSHSALGSSPTPPAVATADQTAVDDSSSDSGQDRISMDELLQQSQLEELSIQLCMEAMWAANVVDISQTLGKVCRAVLYDAASSSKVRLLRAQGLRELGAIFSSVSVPDGAHQQGAKQQVQAAYEAMLAKQLAQQDADDATRDL